MIGNSSFSLLSLGEQFYCSLSSQQDSCSKGIFLLIFFQVHCQPKQLFLSYSLQLLTPVSAAFLLATSPKLSLLSSSDNIALLSTGVTTPMYQQSTLTTLYCQQRGRVDPTPSSAAVSYCCHLCRWQPICTSSVIQTILFWFSCHFRLANPFGQKIFMAKRRQAVGKHGQRHGGQQSYLFWL